MSEPAGPRDEDIEELLQLHLAQFPDPVDVFEDNLRELGVVRHPTSSGAVAPGQGAVIECQRRLGRFGGGRVRREQVGGASASPGAAPLPRRSYLAVVTASACPAIRWTGEHVHPGVEQLGDEQAP